MKNDEAFSMKKKKITAISLMLATAALSAAFSGAFLNTALTASAATDNYELDGVFAEVSGSDVKTATVGEDTFTAFELKDEASVRMKRHLAYKWYVQDDADTAKVKKGKAAYLTVKFAFSDTAFNTVDFAFESPSAWATEGSKATNTVRFKKTATGVKAYVVYGEVVKYDETAAEDTLTAEQKEFKAKEQELLANAQEFTVTANETLTLSLTQDAQAADGEFTVLLSSVTNPIGKFENVGANSAEYTYNSMHPLTVSADLGKDDDETVKDAKTTVVLNEINGQSFKLTDGKIVDNAAPVLVIHENIHSFLLGTAFALDYDYIDVLDDDVTSSDATWEFYQYNPANETVGAEEDEFAKYKSNKNLTNSIFFQPTEYSYTPAGATEAVKTTVFKNTGAEYLAARVKLGDASSVEDTTFDLAWYASNPVQIKGKTDIGMPDSDLYYIVLDRNESGATYKEYVETVEEAGVKKSVKSATQDAAVESFNARLAEIIKDEDIYAGSNSYINFPSFKWLIDDNNGYRNLKFTISYRVTGSESESTSTNLAYNAIKLSVAKEGTYEFKIFAVDPAGNAMKYYLDGKEVDVTSGNVWDIDAIPYFTFEIENKGLKVEDPTSQSGRKDTEVLDKTYTIDDIKVVGATNLQEKYSLYKVNLAAYNEGKEDALQITRNDLTAITYQAIAEKVNARLSTVQNGDYFGMYLKAYAELLAVRKDATNVEATANEIVTKLFTKIGEQGDNVNNATDEFEKYEWNPSSQSFKTVEEGEFFVLADYWEKDTPTATRAAAYMVVVVESKTAVIEGDDNFGEWIEQNLVSVILFAIAGVMLILIVILLLVKPSDETLEDVDAKAAKEKKTNKDEE